VRRAALATALVAGSLALPAGASAAGYPEGDYFGTTSQGGDMIMLIEDGRVLRYGFELRLDCRRGRRTRKSSGRYTNRIGAKIGGDGRFEQRRSSGGFKPVLKGRVTETGASGTFRLTFSKNGERCKSPLVRWEASTDRR
jgi:hypothetical protein